MADAQVETFRPTGLLQVDESMAGDTALSARDSFVPNGLLEGHLVNQPSSSIQDMSLHPTSVPPTSPFRQNGLLDIARTEPGACSM